MNERVNQSTFIASLRWHLELKHKAFCYYLYLNTKWQNSEEMFSPYVWKVILRMKYGCSLKHTKDLCTICTHEFVHVFHKNIIHNCERNLSSIEEVLVNLINDSVLLHIRNGPWKRHIHNDNSRHKQTHTCKSVEYSSEVEQLVFISIKFFFCISGLQ